MARNPTPMLDHRATMMTMGRRYLVSTSHTIGSVMTPSFIRILFR